MNFGYKKLYINGSLQDSEEGSKQDVICPATGEKIAQIAEAGKSDAIKALNDCEYLYTSQQYSNVHHISLFLFIRSVSTLSSIRFFIKISRIPIMRMAPS